MGIVHFPKAGEILLCDFRGFEKPEMIKRRPVVVVADQLPGRNPNLVTIVPLSSQRSRHDLPFQIQVILTQPLSPKFELTEVWAKCDMIAVVSRNRLDRFKIVGEGERDIRWLSGRVSKEQLVLIRKGVAYGLGFDLDKTYD